MIEKKQLLYTTTMQLLTGDECGVMKQVLPQVALHEQRQQPKTSFSIKTITDSVHGIRPLTVTPTMEMSRRKGIVSMTWTDTDDQHKKSFASLAANGTIHYWQSSSLSSSKGGTVKNQTYQPVTHLDNVFATKDRSTSSTDDIGRPLSLHGLGKDRRVLCAVNSQGTIVLLPKSSTRDSTTNPTIVTRFSAVSKKPSHLHTPTRPKDHPSVLSAVAVVENWIAMGGRDQDIVVVNATTQQTFWKAKNLPPHPQTLLQPLVWPSSLLFWNQQQDTNIPIQSNLLLCGSAHKELRLYDVRANGMQRRPQSYTPKNALDYRVTALCQINNHTVAVGDASGGLYLLDIRKLTPNSRRDKTIPIFTAAKPTSHATNTGLPLRRCVGPAGSIRYLQKHPTLPLLVGVGLDRHLRIYDTNTQTQLCSMYLKQRLNCVLLEEDEDDKNWDWNAGERRTDLSKVPEEEDENSREDDVDDGDVDQGDLVEDYVDSDDQDSDEEGDDFADLPGLPQAEQVSSGSSSESEESESENDDSVSSSSEEVPQRRKRQKRR